MERMPTYIDLRCVADHLNYYHHLMILLIMLIPAGYVLARFKKYPSLLYILIFILRMLSLLTIVSGRSLYPPFHSSSGMFSCPRISRGPRT